MPCPRDVGRETQGDSASHNPGSRPAKRDASSVPPLPAGPPASKRARTEAPAAGAGEAKGDRENVKVGRMAAVACVFEGEG